MVLDDGEEGTSDNQINATICESESERERQNNEKIKVHPENAAVVVRTPKVQFLGCIIIDQVRAQNSGELSDESEPFKGILGSQF